MAERFSTGLRNQVLKTGGTSYAGALVTGVIYLFSGSQPTTADATEGTATKLVEISVGSVAYVPATNANGISMGTAAAGVLSKAAEVWSGTNLADGVIGWGRFHGNLASAIVIGASETAIRMDFRVSQSGAELDAGNTTVVTGGTTTISTFTITLPAG